MRVRSFVELALLGALAGCAGGQANVGSSLGEKPVESANDEQTARGEAGAPSETAAKKKPVAEEEPAGPPPPDPAVVKALVEKTGEPASSTAVDNPLHLRLEITPRPAGELWVLAVVNRGTEPAKVQLDLRRLSLELTPPQDEKKPAKPRGKTATITCKLPEGFGGMAADEAWRSLEAGEGLVQTFDPRLYCVSASGDSLLSTGQHITAKLGYTPKPPRAVYKAGKRVEAASAQTAPFIAEPATAAAEPADPEHDSRVKQLVATAVVLTPDLTANEAEEDPSLPLSLKFVHGSDAAAEINTTATVEVRAKKKTMLYFRRELVSFTVHGPDGIHGCDPQPDERAPDRQAYTPLAAGQSISATSLLAEMCPKYTFARPGLYLVSARLDALRDGSEFGLSAFTGRLESRKEALVRIRTGDFPALPPPEPLRVRVGQ
jgi:hypothetical protein